MPPGRKRGTKPPAGPPRAAFEDYIAGVLEGRVVVGRLARLAVERHLRDLERGPSRGLVFSREAALEGCAFFEDFLPQTVGEWAGLPFHLLPWQAFVVAMTEGWRREDGRRRFRIVYVQQARKNGKTTFAAGYGNKLFLDDDEPRAEVYSFATKRKQALICWQHAEAQLKGSEHLARAVRFRAEGLFYPRLGARFEALGADKDSTDGLNVHGAIVDELHAWKGRKLFDVIRTSLGARRQPLIFIITTPGFSRESICWEQRAFAEKVLEGKVSEEHGDHFLPFVCEPDRRTDEDGKVIEDDWTAVETWMKGNPSLGVSPKIEELVEQCAEAKVNLGAQNNFKRLRCGMWTEQADRIVDLQRWRALAEPADEAALARRECYAGLDLAASSDFTAWALAFPPKGADPWRCLVRLFFPRGNVDERVRGSGVRVDLWIEQGAVTATEGEVCDYGVVRERVLADSRTFRIRQIAYDDWDATQLSTELAELGLPMVKFIQGPKSYNPAVKLLLDLIKTRALRHPGNPCLDWMAGNLAVRRDVNLNMAPCKKSSAEKIDGMVALLMALGAAIRGGAGKQSVYATRSPLECFGPKKP